MFMGTSMSTQFEKYNDVLLDAFQSNLKSFDLIAKKKEILTELIDHYDQSIITILFIGFTPSLLGMYGYEIYVTEVSNEVQDFLRKNNVKFTYVESINASKDRYDMIVALDEYLTFAATDNDQRDLINTLCSICNKFIVTTLKDYKNQDYRDKEFSQPILVKSHYKNKIYFEHYEFDSLDRNFSFGTNYIIDDDGATIVGPFPRRNMFFKQLAKFSLDAGANNFLVHKNLMHKSIIKKNYEHIITIKF